MLGNELEKVDLSKYKYDELHEYFAKKFGRIDEGNNENEANDDVEDVNSAHVKVGEAINQLDRVKMNAEIFAGIGDNAINTSSSLITSRAIYLTMFILVVLFAIYAMAFNPSLIKRTFHICGCDSYFGAKATL